MRGKICADLPKHSCAGKHECLYREQGSAEVTESGQWSSPEAPVAERTQLQDVEWVWTTLLSLAGSLEFLHSQCAPCTARPSLAALPAGFPPCDEFCLRALCSLQRPNATKGAKAAGPLLVTAQSELDCSFGVCKDSW